MEPPFPGPLAQGVVFIPHRVDHGYASAGRPSWHSLPFWPMTWYVRERCYIDRAETEGAEDDPTRTKLFVMIETLAGSD